MADYKTATANDVPDLMDKLRGFAEDEGWTILRYDNRPSQPTQKVLILQKGLCNVSLWGDGNTYDGSYPGPHIYGVLFDTFDGSKNEDTQPGSSSQQFTNYLVGPFQSYHFFSGDGRNGPYIHVVVETSAGVFKHFGFGIIDKQGEFNTGSYLHMSSWNMQYSVNSTNYRGDPGAGEHTYPWDVNGYYHGTAVRADRDAQAPNYAYADNNSGRNLNVGFRDWGWTRPFIVASPSVTTGVDPFGVLNADVSRPSGFRSCIGAPPDLQAVNMTDFDAKQHVTLGGDEWILFPAHRKNGVLGEVNSGVYGYAYRVPA